MTKPVAQFIDLTEYRVKFTIKDGEWLDSYQSWMADNCKPGWAVAYNRKTYYFASFSRDDAVKFREAYGGRIQTRVLK